MGELIEGDDGLPADGDVGEWVEDKHRALQQYLNLHSGARAQFSGHPNAYIDVFCGPGRAKVRGSSRYVDGSPLVAWKASVEKRTPFGVVYIADSDADRRRACAERLRKLNAPVVEIPGEAAEAAIAIVPKLDPYGLHFAFIDPYSLGALRLDLIRTLAGVRRMDMLIHLSAMDLFRNFDRNWAGEQQEFDAFAPGWRENIPDGLTTERRRTAVVDYWKHLVDAMGLEASAEMKAIRNTVNRDLYWLLLLARHDLAQKFWKIVIESGPQRRLI